MRHGVALVVIDVLNVYLGADVDGHKDQDVRRALMPLAKLAERTAAAVVVLRHLNKSTGGPAIYRGAGSIGIGAQRDPSCWRASTQRTVSPHPCLPRLQRRRHARGARIRACRHPRARMRPSRVAGGQPPHREHPLGCWIERRAGRPHGGLRHPCRPPLHRPDGCPRCPKTVGGCRREQANPRPSEEASRGGVAETGSRRVGVVSTRPDDR